MSFNKTLQQNTQQLRFRGQLAPRRTKVRYGVKLTIETSNDDISIAKVIKAELAVLQAVVQLVQP